MSDNSLDIRLLLHHIGSIDLPPFVEEKFWTGIENLLLKIKEEQIPIYKFSDEYKKIVKIVHDEKNNALKHPNYIYHKGSEAIKYFTYKKNGGTRPMGIANPIWYVAFIYNIVEANKCFLFNMYNDDKLEEYIIHSNSPILKYKEKSNEIYFVDYKDEIVSEFKFKTEFGGLNNLKNNITFNETKRKVINFENTNPRYLKTDIESYFQNVYTHNLENLYDKEPWKTLSVNNYDMQKFFEFLDYYNMAINENHTKGILQGPLSSAISAEFLGISLDFEIHKTIINEIDSDLKVPFSRFVDDFTFFSKDTYVLESISEKMDYILRKNNLLKKEEKTKIVKGFIPEIGADIDEIYLKFSFFNDHMDNALSKDDINTIKRYLKSLITGENIAQIRTMLTMLKKWVNTNPTRIVHSQFSVEITFFLITMIYIMPQIGPHAYKLIDAILNNTSSKNKKYIINKIMLETNYIDKHFGETDIQIWHYYLLSKYQGFDSLNKTLSHLLGTEVSSSIYGIILSFYIKDNVKNNLRIFDYVCRDYQNKTKNKKISLNGSNSSAWWLVIVKLFLYCQDKKNFSNIKTKQDYTNMKKKINQLFRNGNKNNYSEFGIFMDLFNL